MATTAWQGLPDMNPSIRAAVWDAMVSQFPARIWLLINYVVTYCTSEALSIFFS